MCEDDLPRPLAVDADALDSLENGLATALEHVLILRDAITMNASDCILFSGGAPGAEAEFGACAERHAVEEVNFTFEGHKIVRQRGVRVLNHEELQNGDVSLEYVSRLMDRRYTDAPTIRKVLQTMWYQVNSGQEIYVIGAIQADDTVRGGTGQTTNWHISAHLAQTYPGLMLAGGFNTLLTKFLRLV
jgi:ribosomal protein L20A (L18A)